MRKDNKKKLLRGLQDLFLASLPNKSKINSNKFKIMCKTMCEYCKHFCIGYGCEMPDDYYKKEMQGNAIARCEGFWFITKSQTDMTNTEKIRQEIERRIKSAESCPFIEAEFGAEMRREGRIQTYNEILSFIDSLPKETPTPKEAMRSLDEKIKSAKKSWEGVDADEYMDEVRGRDETVTDCHQLEDEIKRYHKEDMDRDTTVADVARHFAKWGAEHLIAANKMIGDHIADDSKKAVNTSQELEEAARNSWFNYEFDCGALYSKCYKDGYKAGANWQREQDESRKRTNVTLANTYHPKDKQVEIAFEDIWLDAEVSVEAFGAVDANLTNSMKSLCHDFFEAGTDWQKEQMKEEAGKATSIITKQ